MAENEGCACCCSMLMMLVVIILSTVLTGVSIANVDYWNSGLLINTVSKAVSSSSVYLPGK